MDMEKTKRCEKCGRVFTYRWEKKVLCDECIRLRNAEQERYRREQRRAEAPLKKCPICGGPIMERRRHYCSYCSNLTKVERDAELIRKRQREERKDSTLGLRLEEIAALAKQYRPPYCTYGKLRSYIYMTGSLPPEEYRRGATSE